MNDTFRKWGVQMWRIVTLWLAELMTIITNLATWIIQDTIQIPYLPNEDTDTLPLW